MADKLPQSGGITKDFYILNQGFVCMYILDGSDFSVAFDTGMRPRKVLEEMAKLGLDPGRVRHVFLTHSDSDHVGGLSAFPNAQVYFPRAEETMIDGSTPRFFGLMHNKPFAAEYTPLEDGQSVKLDGYTVQCIATPGHTAGHMSYLVDDTVLIVGDVLNLKHGKAVMDRSIINIDNNRRRESIRKLARIQGLSFMCPMHSAYTSEVDGAMAEWRRKPESMGRR